MDQKYSNKYKRLDLSDWGRKPAQWLVRSLLFTKIGAHSLTICHLFLGFLAAILIAHNATFFGAMLLLARNIVDAADGEMARARRRPSYVGRYLDSLCDFWANLAIFMGVSYLAYSTPIYGFLMALISMVIVSHFNHYGVLVRHSVAGC